MQSRVIVGPQETYAIEVNQMVRIICHPYLSFPGYFSKVAGQVTSSGESSNKYDAILNRSKKLTQFDSPFRIHWTMAGHRLYQHKPPPSHVIEYCIRHFAMAVNYTQRRKQFLVKITPFVTGVANVHQTAAWHKAGCELLYYSFQ